MSGLFFLHMEVRIFTYMNIELFCFQGTELAVPKSFPRMGFRLI